MVQLTHKIVKEALTPLKEKFHIPYDGTSQTRYGNTGRFGFYVERRLGISPNSLREADTEYAEVKSVNIKNKFTINPVSIGTIPYHEYRYLKNNFPNVYFTSSDPYKKMLKTLYVFYRKESQDEPEYKVEQWVHVDIDSLDRLTKQILENDFWFCVKAMSKYTYDTLSNRTDLNPSTQYLRLGYKGDGYYNYPCWKFSPEFLKKMYEIGESAD